MTVLYPPRPRACEWCGAKHTTGSRVCSEACRDEWARDEREGAQRARKAMAAFRVRQKRENTLRRPERPLYRAGTLEAADKLGDWVDEAEKREGRLHG